MLVHGDKADVLGSRVKSAGRAVKKLKEMKAGSRELELDGVEWALHMFDLFLGNVDGCKDKRAHV